MSVRIESLLGLLSVVLGWHPLALCKEEEKKENLQDASANAQMSLRCLTCWCCQMIKKRCFFVTNHFVLQSLN